MKRLIGHEARKLLHQKVFWGILLGLFCVNALFFHYQINLNGELGFSPRDIAATYEKIEGLSPQEQLQFLQDEVENCYEAIMNGEPVPYGTSQLVGIVSERIETILGYDDYLASVDANADRMMSSILFGVPGTFSYRNILKTPGAYAHLKGLKLTVDVPDGVNAFVSQPLTDAMILLVVVVLVLQLALAERENGVLSLIKSK